MEWDTALEFPDCIGSNGRIILHELADFFMLAHHSVGQKGKSRRMIIYPKTLYRDKQESEVNKLLREREKLREKFAKNMKFDEAMPSKNTTLMDKVLLELWYEKNGHPVPMNVSNYIPSLDDIGKVPHLGRLLDMIELKSGAISRMEKN